MKLKTTLSLVAAAAVALFSHGAFAQEKTRAEVKSETAAANKAGKITTGDLDAPVAKPKSTANRADVKAETKAAEKSGQIATGDLPAKTAKPKSTANRAEVKSETKAANKAGDIATGEGNQQSGPLKKP
jgi:hypothetical protein